MPVSRSFGPLDVIALQDAEGPFFESRQEAFPQATAEHWRRADALDPAAVRDGEWLLRFRCYALRHDDGGVILVDAGIGGSDAGSQSWTPRPGRLPAELAAAGIAPGDVETVVLTHMHSDHIGWAVDRAAGIPYFPNARYLLQRTEIDTIERHDPALAACLLEPLRAAGRLSEVEGEAELGGGVRALATPGHTQGHQSVVLQTERDALLITGDLLVHAVQLVEPALPYAYETDPEVARTSRAMLLRDLAARGSTILATAHLGEPFIPLVQAAVPG